jgi:hypothetical protein
MPPSTTIVSTLITREPKPEGMLGDRAKCPISRRMTGAELLRLLRRLGSERGVEVRLDNIKGSARAVIAR